MHMPSAAAGGDAKVKRTDTKGMDMEDLLAHYEDEFDIDSEDEDAKSEAKIVQEINLIKTKSE